MKKWLLTLFSFITGYEDYNKCEEPPVSTVRTVSLYVSLPNGVFCDLQQIAAANKTTEERLIRRIIVEWLEGANVKEEATDGSN